MSAGNLVYGTGGRLCFGTGGHLVYSGAPSVPTLVYEQYGLARRRKDVELYQGGTGSYMPWDDIAALTYALLDAKAWANPGNSDWLVTYISTNEAAPDIRYCRMYVETTLITIDPAHIGKKCVAVQSSCNVFPSSYYNLRTAVLPCSTQTPPTAWPFQYPASDTLQITATGTVNHTLTTPVVLDNYLAVCVYIDDFLDPSPSVHTISGELYVNSVFLTVEEP